MPEDVDPKPQELENEPKEPWPVWWAWKPGDPSKLGWWVTVGLPLTFYAAVAAMVFWVLAILNGHTEIPMLLFWLHFPLWFALQRRGRRWRRRHRGGATETEEEPVEGPTQWFRATIENGPGEWEAEKGYGKPDVGSEYVVLLPLLLGDEGLETMRRPLPPWKWERFERYEYVGESGGAFTIRLVPKAGYEADTEPERPRRRFWRRVAMTLPVWAMFWVFFSALERHGWRVDTLAAFCAVVAHTLARTAFRKLGRLHTNHGLYLVFDSRVVTTGEAFSRLNRYLPGTGEAA